MHLGLAAPPRLYHCSARGLSGRTSPGAAPLQQFPDNQKRPVTCHVNVAQFGRLCQLI